MPYSLFKDIERSSKCRTLMLRWFLRNNNTIFQSTCIYELCESAEITCCVSDDSRTIFTGFNTGKICVWDLTERHTRIRFRRTLTAHTERITALTVCSAQTLLVSGSRDGTVIVWHSSALTFIRQLRPHQFSVTAIAINDTTVSFEIICRKFMK